MKRILIVLTLALSTFYFLLSSSLALAANKEITLFYGRECPHCQAEEKFLDKLTKLNPEVKITRYEVWHNSDNRPLFESESKKYGNDRLAVPLTIINGQAILGFDTDKTTGQEILQKLGIENKGEKGDKEVIKVPIFGQVDIKKLSLPTLTVILGLVDGFNPCAMWALVALLAFLVTLGSRKKVLIIGGSFLAASYLASFLYMTAWLKAFELVAFISYIRYAVAFFSLIVGFIYLRDFFKNKRECDVVDFEQRKKILDRMKNIGSTEFWVTAVIGAVILAITVNIIEFVCSVGLPVIYTQVLAGQHESSAAKYGYILLYCLFYMLDDFIVFIAALFTSRVLTFSGNYSYYSRLVGAIILFLLAAWLVISGIPK